MVVGVLVHCGVGICYKKMFGGRLLGCMGRVYVLTK